MTLNITKKKIEKVLELFNHPQTRKIRKNRGKKRRRNNKSFNRKNGRKNLATSTLKKKGGHAGHHPPLLNGGTVGVVLGGQVGGKGFMESFKQWFSKNKKEIGKEHDKQEEKQNFFNNLYVRYKTWKEKRQQDQRQKPYIDSKKNEVIKNSDDDKHDKVSVSDLLEIDLSEENNNQLSDDEIQFINEYPFLQEIENYKMVTKIVEPDEDKTMENFYPNGGKFKANLKKDFNELKTSINPFTLDVSPYDTQYKLQRPITLTINDKPYELNVTENDFNEYFEILDEIKESNSDDQNSDKNQEDNPEPETDNNKKSNKSAEKVEKPKEESKNDKMMKLLTLREDYTIFNILNNLLPPKEEGQTADLKEIVKKLDFGKFVDEIGILKNDEEESTINEGEGEGEEDGDGDNDNEEVDNDN